MQNLKFSFLFYLKIQWFTLPRFALGGVAAINQCHSEEATSCLVTWKPNWLAYSRHLDVNVIMPDPSINFVLRINMHLPPPTIKSVHIHVFGLPWLKPKLAHHPWAFQELGSQAAQTLVGSSAPQSIQMSVVFRLEHFFVAKVWFCTWKFVHFYCVRSRRSVFADTLYCNHFDLVFVPAYSRKHHYATPMSWTILLRDDTSNLYM